MTKLVVHFTDSSTFGGAEQVILSMLAEIDRRAWDPILIYHPAPCLAPLLDGARRLGVRLRPVPAMPEGWQGPPHLPTFIRTLRALKPMVFHAHLASPMACKYGLVGAALACVPAVIAWEHLFLDLSWNRSSLIKHRLISTGVDRYVAVSRDLAWNLRRTFAVPLRKVEVVHNGVRVTDFERRPSTSLRSRLEGFPPKPIVLTNGRLDLQKGHRYLLNAAAQLPEVRLVFAGDGPEREHLQSDVRQLGLTDRVVFLGYRDDVPDLLASCDVFVLPSLFEGLPLSILEAMAAGKPIIATEVGGTPEAIAQGQTGILVPPKDPDALAASLRTVLSNQDLAERLGKAARTSARKHFSAVTMVQNMTRIYEEILDSTGGSKCPATTSRS